jgi:hypothetical protein
MPRWVRFALPVLSVLLFVPALPAADEAAIQRAIEKGVAYLKSIQGTDGKWPREDIGATSLAALTLLECDVPANDPAIQKAANAVRESSINLTKTYSLALNILFLDRLGEPVDKALIESMAVRLLAGQTAQGGWSYDCPAISPTEEQRLRAALRQRNELVARGELPKPNTGGGRRDFKEVTPEIQAQVTLLDQKGPGLGGGALNLEASDNSNTQFATLALWAARRQGIPVEKALARVEARFRGCQQADGGWTYQATPQVPAGPVPAGAINMMREMASPAMTCAGLLGLATGYGVGTETALRTAAPGANLAEVIKKLPDMTKDPNVKAGLAYLAAFLENPEPAGNWPNSARNATMGPKKYYFLWSLERVAMAYNLETIMGKDWYGWASNVLVKDQGGDGSWSGGEFPQGGCDTSFALLCLRRANLAGDLSELTRGRFKDPNSRELRASTSGVPTKNPGGTKPVPGKDDKKVEAKPPDVKPLDSKPAVTPEQPVPAPPSKAADPETARLSDELANAQPAQQDQVIEKLRDSKGSVYTQALADVIPRLTGPVKTKARDALAERLTRMTAKTLDGQMGDDNSELRRAAALASAMKEEKSLIPRLIALLEDKEPTVVRASHAALKDLTKEDYGPAETTAPEISRAVTAWKAWWAKNGGK